jgi:hypothetical protein
MRTLFNDAAGHYPRFPCRAIRPGPAQAHEGPARNFRDLTGQVFGRLTIRALAWMKPIPGGARAHWRCECFCGQNTVVCSNNLTNGHTTSCGCLQREVSTARCAVGDSHRIHGHSPGHVHSPTYSSWKSMIARCTNPNVIGFELYGGRGIPVCDRWRNSFEAFLNDMGERPPGTTINRIDPDWDYEPGDYRWVTPKEQANNHQKVKRNPVTLIAAALKRLNKVVT